MSKTKVATTLDAEILSLAKKLVQYYEDPEYAYQQEIQAAEATDGNVSAFESLAQALSTRLTRFLAN